MARKRSGIARLWSCALLVLVLLGVVALAGWGVWRLVSTYIPPTWARLWALVATILLPVAFATGYNLGLTESRGKLKGIDAGLERVTKAAATAIDLRAASARAMRQATRAEPPGVVLPNVEPVITVRPQLESGEVEL